MARIRLESLRDDLPQGVWQDTYGSLYSTDGRAGSWPVLSGSHYYRRDLCERCNGPAIVTWYVDLDGGVTIPTCLAACGAPDAAINPGEPF